MVAAERLPNLFLVGVPKAGTTALARWLTDHPAVAGGREKELRFLMDPDDSLARPDGYAATGLAGYGRHFARVDPARASYLLDASPEYYYQQTALEVVAALENEPRVLFVFRDPARRIYSLFRFAQHNQAVLAQQVSFREFVADVRDGGMRLLRDRPMLRNCIRQGAYAPYVQRWMQAVPAARIRFLLFEEMADEPAGVVQALARWLGIDPAFYGDYHFAIENETYRVRSPLFHRAMRATRQLVRFAPGRRAVKQLYYGLNTRPADRPLDDEERETLASLRAEFAEANRALAALTGLDLSSWAGDGA